MCRLWAAVKRVVVGVLIAGLGIAMCIGALDIYVLLTTCGEIARDPVTAPGQPYALILGNSLMPGGAPCPTLEERLDTGLALYASGRVARVIVSGMKTGDDYDEARAMKTWLVGHGARAGDIVVDSGGYRTAASIANAANGGVRAVLIVSQWYHLPRALYFARHAGMAALGVVAPTPSSGVESALYFFLRETTARAEAVVEVLLRGVRS